MPQLQIHLLVMSTYLTEKEVNELEIRRCPGRLLSPQTMLPLDSHPSQVSLLCPRLTLFHLRVFGRVRYSFRTVVHWPVLHNFLRISFHFHSTYNVNSSLLSSFQVSSQVASKNLHPHAAIVALALRIKHSTYITSWSNLPSVKKTCNFT